jgi:hypothetical protein
MLFFTGNTTDMILDLDHICSISSEEQHTLDEQKHATTKFWMFMLPQGVLFFTKNMPQQSF